MNKRSNNNKNNLHYVKYRISPIFLGKVQFPHSFRRFAQMFGDIVLSRKISTPRNQVKLWYFTQCQRNPQLNLFQLRVLFYIETGFRLFSTSLRNYTPYIPLCACALRALRALPALLTPHICAPCGPFLHALPALFGCLQDGFVVHQKLPIFQRILKALQTVLFLCGSKNSHETF